MSTAQIPVLEYTHSNPTNALQLDERIEWFTDLLRKNAEESIAHWSARLLDAWVPLFSGLQASLYWTIELEAPNPHLQLLQTYACKADEVQTTIQWGEGLVGQSARSNRVLYFNDRSRFRVNTTTNLSAIVPAAYLVLPLVYNHKVEGVMEMTLMKTLDEQDFALIRRLGFQLGAALNSLHNEDVTQKLYQAMQQKTEELISQDEEMRQNLEEMQATQEELKRTKEEIERKKEQFEMLAGNLQGALFQMNLNPQTGDRKTTYLSSQIEQLLGYTTFEIGHEDLFGFMKIDDEQFNKLKEKRQLALETGKPFTWTGQYKTDRISESRWLRIDASVRKVKTKLNGDQPSLVLSDGYLHDVTAEMQREQDLILKTEVFSSSYDSIWILHGATIIDCNDASSILFGAPDLNSMIGTSPLSWSPELQPNGSYSEELAASLIHKAMTDGFHEFEWKYKRMNGEEFDCEVRLSRIYTEDRVLLSAFHKDISYRKQAEKRLNQNTAILNGSYDSIWVLNGPEIIYCNEASIRLFGANQATDIIGTTPIHWSPEHQPNGRLSSEFGPALIEQAVITGFNSFEWTHKRLDGTEFECEIRLTRIDTEEMVLLSAFIRDLSQIKAAEKASQEEIENLKICEASKREEATHVVQSLYQTFLDQLDQAVFIVTNEGIPFFANERCIELLGKGIDPNASVDDLSTVYSCYRYGTDDLYPEQELPVVQALSGKDVELDDIELKTPEGRQRIRVHGFPIKDADGQIQFAMATFDVLNDSPNSN